MMVGSLDHVGWHPHHGFAFINWVTIFINFLVARLLALRQWSLCWRLGIAVNSNSVAFHVEWALGIAILAFRFYFHTIGGVKLHKLDQICFVVLTVVQVVQVQWGSLEGIQGACDIRNSKCSAAGGFGGLPSAFSTLLYRLVPFCFWLESE